MEKISMITDFLESAYNVLNEEYFDNQLPRVMITIQSSPKANGHFTNWDAWRNGDKGVKEINLGAESLKRPIAAIIATLIHEMVHYYCCINKIQDTSRQGRYHNIRFKKEAEKRGLKIDCCKGTGYSITSPTDQLKDFILKQGWDKITFGYRDNAPAKIKASSISRKYMCPQCMCSVRATSDVSISCNRCECNMLKVS